MNESAPDMGKRRFLQGAAAGLGALALSGIPKIVGAQERASEAKPETQESKIPSAQEIEKITRDTLTPIIAKEALGRKSEKKSGPLNEAIAESLARGETLNRKFLGNQDIRAGHKAYVDDIAPFLTQMRWQYEGNKAVEPVYIEKRKEAEVFYKRRDDVAGRFLQTSREYISAMENYLKAEQALIEAKKLENAMRDMRGLIQEASKLTGESVPAERNSDPSVQLEKPDAGRVRDAAIAYGKANDVLLALRKQYDEGISAFKAKR
mgnify:FL=1